MTTYDSWKILITGITSIHGWPIFLRLQKLLPESRLFGIGPPKSKTYVTDNVRSMCITNRAQLKKIRDTFKPTHVIHCAGVCDLDVCEQRPHWARAINVEGTKIVADIFGDTVPILYLSTDLVFSGNNTPVGGYAENNLPDPVSVVGRTFAEAEKRVQQCRNHCIVRLGLPLGESINGDKGAVDWIEGRFRRSLPVTLFHDEYRSCVCCTEISTMVQSVLESGIEGLFHFGGKKRWSLFDVGEYVLKKGGYSPDLLNGIMRCQEKSGPPRIGDVSLNSDRIKKLMFSTDLSG